MAKTKKILKKISTDLGYEGLINEVVVEEAVKIITEKVSEAMRLQALGDSNAKNKRVRNGRRRNR